MADPSFLEQRLDASTWPVAVGDIVALLVFLLIGTLQHSSLEQRQAEPPGAGGSGGGHLVVGSSRFVPGRRETVVASLVEKMADAELDAELGSATARPDEV